MNFSSIKFLYKLRANMWKLLNHLPSQDFDDLRKNLVSNYLLNYTFQTRLICTKWYPDKIPPEKWLWIPLSANLFRLESSILMRAKRVTNLNNIATGKRSYIFSLFFSGGFFSAGFCRGRFLPRTEQNVFAIILFEFAPVDSESEHPV